MINRNLITSIFLIVALAVNVNGQNNNSTIEKTLKEAYKGIFLIGCADDLTSNNEAYQANIKAQYDIVTPENCMKPQPIHPEKDRYNFVTTDAMVEWCEENGLAVWGHTLGWHSQSPAWFFQTDSTIAAQAAAAPAANPAGQRPNRQGFGGFGGGNTGPQASKEVILERLKDHIMTVVGRYKGRIIGWDVFNESIADGGDGSTENLRNFSWYTAVGPEVLTLAFKWAHEADPEAQLYYNDYNIEQGAVENKGKHASSMILLKRLIAEGAPITGVGIQGHWHLDTNLKDVEKAIENYASLGLRVAITELDVTATGSNSGAFNVNQGDGSIPAENFEKQAEVYKELFEIFMRHKDVIDRVTFWGLSDTRSWRRNQAALLFDGDLNPKPAYHAVIEVAEDK
ncbi:MAG: endo-1,4-beta-xylanase [Prolixibacteraceae bacterium]|nr:endo-1,4-beta-xylanase [Prolixibacteraceae bacterium]